MIGGFTSKMYAFGIGESGFKISPIPSASCVLPSKQYGTSAPSDAPICISSSLERGLPWSIFIAVRTAAQLPLPPASPAATGIFL